MSPKLVNYCTTKMKTSKMRGKSAACFCYQVAAWFPVLKLLFSKNSQNC